ncbi:hypothetical protein BJ875DRAFT_81774 [Amylocarpus encephaloides]|uniref:Zn(2)-C6 fungal-type domain-containing protein n=1 Tax=Amylocarpus encephaloides TaxID=45428 RepID=A0A9P7YFC0_9HELO|nr:hypothetical protein BJ875DRAFT_81774 [Amylocarpus encephaloides]
MQHVGIPRLPPRGACQACHRLKMRCVKQPGSDSCIRCLKVNRDCVSLPAPTPGSRRMKGGLEQGNSSTSRTSQARETIESRSVNTPILPSIYSTSPYSNYTNDTGDRRTIQIDGPGPLLQNQSSDINHERHNEDISRDDTIQLIEMFRQRLVPCSKLITSDDFPNALDLMSNYSDLTTCICYVTSRYVPGYTELRTRLKASVTRFVQNVLIAKRDSGKNDLATMRALLILYIWASASATDQFSNNRKPLPDEINYWLIKTATEGFAMHALLPRINDWIKHRMRSKEHPKHIDDSVQRYMYWLWLYVKSHLVSRVTSTPATIRVDATIQSAANIFGPHLPKIHQIHQLLGEASLCLLWDDLGKKESAINEWWCPVELDGSNAQSRVTFADVDTPLDIWRQKYLFKFNTDSSSNAIDMSLEYHYHYTRFCLNTHFFRHSELNDNPGFQKTVILKCIDSIMSIFNLYHNLGPSRRDQLRYFPDFLFVILSFCSSFILQTIRSFGQHVDNPASVLDLVRNLAVLMIGLGDADSGANINGKQILLQLEKTVAMMKSVPESVTKWAESTISTNMTSGSTRSTLQPDLALDSNNGVEFADFENGFSNFVFGFPNFFDPILQDPLYGIESNSQ